MGLAEERTESGQIKLQCKEEREGGVLWDRRRMGPVMLSKAEGAWVLSKGEVTRQGGRSRILLMTRELSLERRGFECGVAIFFLLFFLFFLSFYSLFFQLFYLRSFFVCSLTFFPVLSFFFVASLFFFFWLFFLFLF